MRACQAFLPRWVVDCQADPVAHFSTGRRFDSLAGMDGLAHEMRPDTVLGGRFMSDSITCPNCSCDIELSAALSSQLREELQRKYDAELRKRDQEFSRKDDELRKREEQLKTSRGALDQELSRRLAAETARLSQEALAKAKETVAVDLKDLQGQLATSKEKLVQAEHAELELRKKQRDLEEQKRSFELQMTRTLDQERGKIRELAMKEAADSRDLKDAEKEKVITDLRREIDNLKRKSEQGSQQLQGEVLELELEDILGRAFPGDTLEPVPKGQHGGDVLHHVSDQRGQLCGTILWESKRTKNWSDGWLPKLRDDQRAARAQVAALVTLEMRGRLKRSAVSKKCG